MPCDPLIEAIVPPQFAILINEAFQVLDGLEKTYFICLQEVFQQVFFPQVSDREFGAARPTGAASIHL